jgi:hypothetical protein
MRKAIATVSRSAFVTGTFKIVGVFKIANVPPNVINHCTKLFKSDHWSEDPVEIPSRQAPALAGTCVQTSGQGTGNISKERRELRDSMPAVCQVLQVLHVKCLSMLRLREGGICPVSHTWKGRLCLPVPHSPKAPGHWKLMEVPGNLTKCNVALGFWLQDTLLWIW